MIGEYYIAQIPVIDIDSFTEAVQVDGLYNLLESAIDTDKAIMICGVRKGKTFLTPSFVTATKDFESGNIIIKGFEAVVSSEDILTPIGGNENES